MRQAIVILFSFLFLSAVRAFPSGEFLIQERHIITERTQLHRRQLLDGLASIANDISSAFDPDPTTTARSVSAATRTADSNDDDDDDETTTSARSTATRTLSTPTSTRTTASSRSTSTSESSSETSTTSESTSSDTSTSSTSSPSATSATTAAASATTTPEPAPESKGGVSTPAIAGGIAGGVVIVAALVVILFWGCGPLKKWRENRAYQRMMDRTYRPALDDTKSFFPEKTQNGLGLNPTTTTTISGGAAAMGGYRGIGPTQPPPAAGHHRAFSFSDDSRSESGIRRKPLPTIGSGGGPEGVSPRSGPYTPSSGHGHAEPWLPAGNHR